MIDILGRASSINVRKVAWLCVELGLIYRIHVPGVDAPALGSEAYLALNPNGLMPVMRDGDFTLWESNAIVRYLARREAREDLLPPSPRACARVDQWLDWQASDLNNAWRYAFLALARKSPAHDDASAIDHSVRQWHKLMRIVDARLSETRGFIAGADFTLADIAIGLSVHRWLATPMGRPRLDAVAAYYERLNAREGFRLHGNNGEA